MVGQPVRQPDGDPCDVATAEASLDGRAEAQRSQSVEVDEQTDATGHEPWGAHLAARDDGRRMGLADLLAERAVGGQCAIQATVELGQVGVGRSVGSDGHDDEVRLDIPWLAIR